MGGHGEKLSRKMEQAIAALLSEPTIAQAAAKVGVTDRALKNWLALPAFAAAFREARMEVLRHTIGRLSALTSKAADALERNASCGNPAAENGAARLILDNAIGGVELLDIVERVAELERRLGDKA
jgi:hypothetical protein